MSVGFFGIPGRVSTGKTHIVNNGRAVCGATFSSGSEFQWCASTADALTPECNKCLRWWARRKRETI